MASVNIEEVVVGFLDANKQSGWEVYGDMPKGERPESFILVDRTGGPRENIVQDRAEILIEVYHKDSRVDASNEANRIADIIKNLESLEPVMRAKVNSLVKLDDLLGSYYRYQIYCDIYYRRELLGEGIIYPVIPSVGVLGIIAGPNITVNDDDPQYPIVSAAGGGGGGGGATDFIYNSSGAQSGNRYNDWSDLIDALAGIDTPIRVFFEQNETIPAGTYSLDNVAFMGNERPYTNTGVIVTIPSAVTISSWDHMKIGAGLSILHQGATPLTSASSGFIDVELLYGNAIQCISAPAISITGSASAIIRKREVTNMVNGGVAPIHVDTTGTVIIVNTGSGSALPNNSISGDISGGYGIMLVDNNASVNPARTDSGLTGSFTFSLASKALTTFFDNSTNGFSATNVQAAIEEAAGGGGGSQTYYQYIYNSSGVQEKNRFNDWSDLMDAIANGQYGPARITFEQDETLPAGTWDLDYVIFNGNGQVASLGGISVTLPDGFVLGGSGTWVGGALDGGLGLIYEGSVPLIDVSSGVHLYDMLLGNTLTCTDEVILKQSGTATVIIRATIGSQIALTGNECFEVGGTGYFIATMGNSAAVIGDNAIKGDATSLGFGIITLEPTANPSNLTRSDANLTGTIPAALSADARLIGFDPTGTGLAATDVADALTELDARTYASEWGDITGTLSAQVDLQAALNQKVDRINGIDEPVHAARFAVPGDNDERWENPGTTLAFTSSADIRTTFKMKMLEGWDHSVSKWGEILTQSRDNGFGALDNFELAVVWANGDFSTVVDKPYIYWEWTKVGDTSESGTWQLDADIRYDEWITLRVTQDFDTNEISFWRQVDYSGDDTTADGKNWKLLGSITHADAGSIAHDSNSPGTWPDGEPWQIGNRFYGDIAMVEAFDGIDGTQIIGFYADDFDPGVGPVTDSEGLEWETTDGAIYSLQPEAGDKITDEYGKFSLGAIDTTDFAPNIIDSDYLFAADSNLRIPTQKAVKSRLAVIPPTSGDWYSMGGQSSAGSPGIVTAGKMLFHPIWLGAGTLDRIAVSTSAAAVSTWRLGLYKANPSNGLPDGQAPFLDAGTVDMNAAPGVQAITISKQITEPGLYWAAVLVDAYTAAPTTHNVTYSSNPGQGILGLPQDMSSLGRYRVGRVHGSTVPTGSLPTAPTSSMSWAGVAPRVSVRYT